MMLRIISAFLLIVTVSVFAEPDSWLTSFPTFSKYHRYSKPRTSQKEPRLGPRYSECPCIAGDQTARFEAKLGLWYMTHGFGFPEFDCATMVFREDGHNNRVHFRSFKADYQNNGSRIIWHGKNFQLHGDQFIAFDANNDKLQYSTTIYHNYDPTDGCVAILCCLFDNPNEWQVLVFCRTPKPDRHQIDQILDIVSKYQSKVPQQLELFKIGHPPECLYNKLTGRSKYGKPNYQNVDVDQLELIYQRSMVQQQLENEHPNYRKENCAA